MLAYITSNYSKNVTSKRSTDHIYVWRLQDIPALTRLKLLIYRCAPVFRIESTLLPAFVLCTRADLYVS